MGLGSRARACSDPRRRGRKGLRATCLWSTGPAEGHQAWAGVVLLAARVYATGAPATPASAPWRLHLRDGGAEARQSGGARPKGVLQGARRPTSRAAVLFPAPPPQMRRRRGMCCALTCRHQRLVTSRTGFSARRRSTARWLCEERYAAPGTTLVALVRAADACGTPAPGRRRSPRPAPDGRARSVSYRGSGACEPPPGGPADERTWDGMPQVYLAAPHVRARERGAPAGCGSPRCCACDAPHARRFAGTARIGPRRVPPTHARSRRQGRGGGARPA